MAYSDSLPARFNPEGYVNWFARNDDIFSYIRKKTSCDPFNVAVEGFKWVLLRPASRICVYQLSSKFHVLYTCFDICVSNGYVSK